VLPGEAEENRGLTGAAAAPSQLRAQLARRSCGKLWAEKKQPSEKRPGRKDLVPGAQGARRSRDAAPGVQGARSGLRGPGVQVSKGANNMSPPQRSESHDAMSGTGGSRKSRALSARSEGKDPRLPTEKVPAVRGDGIGSPGKVAQQLIGSDERDARGRSRGRTSSGDIKWMKSPGPVRRLSQPATPGHRA